MKKIKIFEDLDKIAPMIPTPFYWTDVDIVVRGANEICLRAVGAKAREDFVGKTPFELYAADIAKEIMQNARSVINSGTVMSHEESIKDIHTGEIKYFTAIRSPLYDDDGSIIGLVGSSVEITAEKEAERLRFENELQQQSIQEQEKFKKIVNQVVHDIRSPLSSLQMMNRYASALPEELRITMRDAVTRIEDIANGLLSRYRDEDNVNVDIENEKPEEVLVATSLLEIITEKKYQHQETEIEFKYDFGELSKFAFIKVEPGLFKRMISNLINNSVDAIDRGRRDGVINIELRVDSESVKIAIEDNGKGIPKAIVDKIINNMSITSGKREGHGLGLLQVRETLQKNNATFCINSKVGKGTKILLNFPRIAAPVWIAEEIKLLKDDIVLVLDDDISIHTAWDTRFQAELPQIKAHHCSFADEAIKFITELPKKKQDRVFLLSDYELLNQDMNGLDVISQVSFRKAILVTSHHENHEVRKVARKTNTKILPKQLASDIPISIVEEEMANTKNVDLVILDDSKLFVESIAGIVFKGKIVDSYYDPDDFLDNADQYKKDTKMFLDNNFDGFDIKGVDIAKILHKKGFTNLYLISGAIFDEEAEIPDYVTLVLKRDTDKIKKIRDLS